MIGHGATIRRIVGLDTFDPTTPIGPDTLKNAVRAMRELQRKRQKQEHGKGYTDPTLCGALERFVDRLLK